MDNNRTDPHSVNVGDQSPQCTHVEGSANTSHSGGEAAKIAELEGQLEEMKVTMRAAGLLKNLQKPVIRGHESAAESAADHQVNRERPTNVELVGSSYKTFLNFKPPAFKGGENPLVYRRWIRKMGQTFKSAVFTENQKMDSYVRG